MQCLGVYCWVVPRYRSVYVECVCEGGGSRARGVARGTRARPVRHMPPHHTHSFKLIGIHQTQRDRPLVSEASSSASPSANRPRL